MKIAIAGAGILGLAHAYAYAKRGHHVTVFERSPRAHGASVRNFGMLWPIRFPKGELEQLGALSRRIWTEVLESAKLPYSAEGSLHVAYQDDEAAVIQELLAAEPHRGRWVDAAEARRLCPALVPEGLRGALYSTEEAIVDPRLVIAHLPAFLAERYGVKFHFSSPVLDPSRLEADLRLLCTGDDFETLYPSQFADAGMTRCKLQMLRTVPQPDGWRMGPALAGGLTLRYYTSFEAAPSLSKLKARVAATMPEYDHYGIHVMASQMPDGSITLGDSHEYGLAVDIFNNETIDRLILDYLATFARFPNPAISSRWHGVYAKHPNKPYVVIEPEPGVRVVTGVGGAGMSLSFGLAEKICESDHL